MTRHKSTAVMCILLVLINGLIPSMVGCDTLGGTGLGGSVKARLQMNTDPDDPMIAKFTGIENGDVIIFFGKKDEAGLVTQIELMQYFHPG